MRDAHRVGGRGAWSFRIGIVFAMLGGFALRIVAARGGLWLDEAWSAYLVAQVGTVGGIFWRINHDNNHYLNSLWILLVGPYAPPLLIRTLSIVAGTASIGVAAAIGWRRTPSTGLIAAILFAVSPILVAYGAEARGYGPMLLAMLASVLAIDRWLDPDSPYDIPPPSGALAALTLVGLLAQLTYVFALAAFAGWIVVACARRGTADAAVRETLRVLGPSLAVLAIVVAFIVTAASSSTTGFQAGGYPAFTATAFADALAEAVTYTMGFALPSAWATIAVTTVALLGLIALRVTPDRRPFYLFATIAFPLVLAIALWRIGNAGFARYYLVLVVGLLLLVADRAGPALARAGWRRWSAIGVIALVVGASLYRDVALVSAARGDPGRAIAAMARRAPGGTTILIDSVRPSAVLDIAAGNMHYPLAIRQACPAAPFAFVDLSDGMTAPVTISRCGIGYRLATVGRRLALSGSDWALYARDEPRP